VEFLPPEGGHKNHYRFALDQMTNVTQTTDVVVTRTDNFGDLVIKSIENPRNKAHILHCCVPRDAATEFITTDCNNSIVGVKVVFVLCYISSDQLDMAVDKPTVACTCKLHVYTDCYINTKLIIPLPSGPVDHSFQCQI